MNKPVHKLIFVPSERAYNSVSFMVNKPVIAKIAPKTANNKPMGILMSISIMCPPTRLKLLYLY